MINQQQRTHCRVSLRQSLMSRAPELALLGELVISAIDDIETFIAYCAMHETPKITPYSARLRHNAQAARDWLNGAPMDPRLGWAFHTCVDMIASAVGSDLEAHEFVSAILHERSLNEATAHTSKRVERYLHGHSTKRPAIANDNKENPQWITPPTRKRALP